jgi:hypothetical protein
MATERQGVKNLFYSAGLLEGTETILFFILICLLPAWFAPLALGFAALTALTSLGRVLLARRIFREPAGADSR